MEVLGAVASSLTLAALFKYSFEAFDLIQLYQSQDVEFNHLQLQYKLEKCRLYNWGDKMGLADHSKQNLLTEWHSKDLVSETLQQIINLFCDGQVIRKKYGCDDTNPPAATSLPAPETLHGIARAFDHFRTQSSSSDETMSRLKKTKWVIRDRKKFLVLVSELRSLIDSLVRITSDLSSSARLEEFLRIRIGGITNIDTLLSIASVWKESHPRVASVASTRADSISMTSGRYEFISQWQAAVNSDASADTLVTDIEDQTITELKHSVVSSSLEVEILKGKLKRSLQVNCEALKYLTQQHSYILKAKAKLQHRITTTTIITVCVIVVARLFSTHIDTLTRLFPFGFQEYVYANVQDNILYSICIVTWACCFFRGCSYISDSLIRDFNIQMVTFYSSFMISLNFTLPDSPCQSRSAQ